MRIRPYGIHCADHETPFYPQKLALSSSTSGGRSVNIVVWRIKAKDFGFVLNAIVFYFNVFASRHFHYNHLQRDNQLRV
jgi:hypothetical protein